MGSAVLISKPYSDNIITIDFSPVHSTGKNYDVTRHEGFNSAVEPIRDPNDITKALEYFYSKGEYRNWCIFQLGITSGLRASDLLRLKVSDVANPVCGGGYQVKHGVKFRLECKKTKRFHKHVTVQITPAAEKTLQIYLDLMGKPGCKYENYFKNNGYLFPSGKRSNSNSKRSKTAYKQPGDPIDVDVPYAYGNFHISEPCKKVDICPRDDMLGYVLTFDTWTVEVTILPLLMPNMKSLKYIL